MPFPTRRASIGLALGVVLVGAAGATSILLREPLDPLRIALNDNLDPAGRASRGVLTVTLEAREGDWRPNGEDGVVLRVAAFAEAGRAMQAPGPLLRMRTGTEVRATVRNTLPEALMVYGLGERRGVSADSVLIASGASHEFRFTAGEPGVYYYAGRTKPVPSLFERFDYDSQLNGALVIDAADAPARPRDRVFVLSQHFVLDSTTVSGLAPNAVLAINGRMWPHTEVLEAEEGDSLDWRWINASILPHPMHLHGFYFRIDARGDDAAYRVLPQAERTMAVTELMMPGTTLGLTWSPNRPGNWVFHCHFAGHMAPDEATMKDRRHPVTIAAAAAAAGGHGDHAAPGGPSAGAEETGGMAAHVKHNMSGLVLGIRVKSRVARPAAPADARAIRLLMRSHPEVWGEYAGYSFVLGDTEAERDPNARSVPGPTLVLLRGEPVAVTLINQSHEPAAVHWHGIELESYPDGVPGWSGEGGRILPLVAPGDSLTVRFTPPRAGTFMYHSHFNELQQIGSGMYGAIVVLDAGETLDPETDRVLLFSDGGPTVNFIAGPFPPVLLNGVQHPSPMLLRAGVRHRLRLINITAEGLVGLGIFDGETPVEWRPVARDGADLPMAQRKPAPARLVFPAGMIHDFEFTPAHAGELTLRFGPPELPADDPATVSVKLVVK